MEKKAILIILFILTFWYKTSLSKKAYNYKITTFLCVMWHIADSGDVWVSFFLFVSMATDKRPVIICFGWFVYDQTTPLSVTTQNYNLLTLNTMLNLKPILIEKMFTERL